MLICSILQHWNSVRKQPFTRETKTKKKQKQHKSTAHFFFRATICSNNDKLHGTLVHRTEWLTPPHQHQIFYVSNSQPNRNQIYSVFMQIFHLNPWLRGWFFFSHRQRKTHKKNANLNCRYEIISNLAGGTIQL